MRLSTAIFEKMPAECSFTSCIFYLTFSLIYCSYVVEKNNYEVKKNDDEFKPLVIVLHTGFRHKDPEEAGESGKSRERLCGNDRLRRQRRIS